MTRDPAAWARLGRALREARERRGLTQAELARLAGVSVGSVQAREMGEVPKKRVPYALAAIAKALGWPPGTVEKVLAGGSPPAVWVDRPAPVDAAQAAAAAIREAMIRTIDTATAAEIRAATELALAELRRHGVIPDKDKTVEQQNKSRRNTS